jgi:hypothetical protein
MMQQLPRSVPGPAQMIDSKDRERTHAQCGGLGGLCFLRETRGGQVNPVFILIEPWTSKGIWTVVISQLVARAPIKRSLTSRATGCQVRIVG